jgi:hypothetical protein
MDEPDRRQLSLLILDGFNSLITDEVNVSFIKILYRLINGDKNFFVVVITHNKDVCRQTLQSKGRTKNRPASSILCRRENVADVERDEVEP